MSASAGRLAGCEGKTGYLSWRLANKSLSRGRFTDRNGRGDLKVYRCRYCHKYHVGRSA